MATAERIFVQAIRRYCWRHDIAVDVRLDGWLIMMQRGDTRRFAFGYDIGLNSAIAHRLANDKSATAEVLAMSDVPCIAHRLFLNPKLGIHVVAEGREAVLALLRAHRGGIVLKPSEGTAGRFVFRATTAAEMDRAVGEIFSAGLGLVISPYLDIEDEVRVILLDEGPMVVFSKQRPSVVGDGVNSLRELACGMPAARLGELDEQALSEVVPHGERRILNWRHNLDAGSVPVLIEDGSTRTACVALATDAARAIGINFASVDLVRVDGAWRVLEINSGVMMEALARLHPDLVFHIYDAALDRLFAPG